MTEAEGEGPRGFASCVHAYRSAAYNQPVGQAVIPLDTALIDRLGEFNAATSRITPRKAGFYVLIGKVEYSAGAINVQMDLQIRLNSVTTIADQKVRPPVVGWWPTIQTEVIAYVDKGEYVDLWMDNGAANVRPIAGAGNRYGTYLSVQRLS